MLKLKNNEFKIIINYKLQKTKTALKKDESPYPKDVIKNSQKKLVSFLKKKKITIIESMAEQPFISVKVDAKQYGDLFLNYENLSIKSVRYIE